MNNLEVEKLKEMIDRYEEIFKRHPVPDEEGVLLSAMELKLLIKCVKALL